MSKEKPLCLPQIPQIKKLSNSSKAISRDFEHYLTCHLGGFLGCVPSYLYEAMALCIRDRLMLNWQRSWQKFKRRETRRAYYLSLEFLIGRSLGNNLLNLGIEHATREALEQYALKLEDLESQEHDAGLGNGGLGRLAACFMDSCATLGLPVIGYGIRYEYGMFHQQIIDGYQVEAPDHWLRDGNPWEIERQEFTQTIKFGGHVEIRQENDGNTAFVWHSSDDVLAIPFDLPVSGYANDNVNTLRLWRATATNVFSLEDFNAGSYSEAVGAKNAAEDISMVLYPNDSSENGKELRLKQQYFLASATLQDVIRMWSLDYGDDFSLFAEKNVFQMNDTHPTIAVAELMRILLDEKKMGWDAAWKITTSTMAYTNHTLLPEALEKWPVSLFEKLLPRLLQIIYEINARFLQLVARHWPGDTRRLARMSIIEEGPVKQVRMAYLAIVGSFSVNGVAALHSRLLTEGLFHDFYQLWPHKFNNKTNGVTPRRWIAHANPGLTELISSKIGEGWKLQLEEIHKIGQYAEDETFVRQWYEVKQANKKKLAAMVADYCHIDFDIQAMFDVQVKRIHEYKRQLLNVLHVIHLYDRIKRGDTTNWVNRCVLIGGKAAPGYAMAKKIIKLINNVSQVIENDPQIGSRLKLAFIPNYCVSKMEIICPGTDLSEQISTAGKEASGTGNMKFMMNGALTMGTYDGANIEILEQVGVENFFLFGLKAEEVEAMRKNYQPGRIIDADEDLRRVIHLLQCGHFNALEPGLFDDIIASLLDPQDPWLTLADFRSYVEAQQQAARAYKDHKRWLKMSILNTAASGFFSTDRTMREYNRDIWKLEPCLLDNSCDTTLSGKQQ